MDADKGPHGGRLTAHWWGRDGKPVADPKEAWWGEIIETLDDGTEYRTYVGPGPDDRSEEEEASHEPQPKIQVPDPERSWDQIWNFALTYNGYSRHGVEASGSLANAAYARWERDGSLPDDVVTLRCCLFFEQRRFRHFGSNPTGEAETYVRCLVRRINEVSGGRLDGPPDEFP